MYSITPRAPSFISAKQAQEPAWLALDEVEAGRLRSILGKSFVIPLPGGATLELGVRAFLANFARQIHSLGQGIFGSSVAEVVASKPAHDVDVYFIVPRSEWALAEAEKAFYEITASWGITPNKRFCLDDEALFLGVEGLDLVILLKECQARTHISEDEELRIHVSQDGASALLWGQGLTRPGIEERKSQICHDACVIRHPERVYSLFFRLVHKERKEKILHEPDTLYAEGHRQVASTKPGVLSRQFENLLKHYDKSDRQAVVWQVLELGKQHLAGLVQAAPGSDDPWLVAMKQHPQQVQALWQLRRTRILDAALELAESGVAVDVLGFDCTEAAKNSYRTRSDQEKPGYLRRIEAPWFKDTAWLERQRHVCVLLEKGEELKKLKIDAWVKKAENLPQEPAHRAALQWFLEQQLPAPQTEAQHLAVARAVVNAQLPVALRPDLQGLNAKQLSDLAVVEGEEDSFAQLELCYELRKTPALHVWLERQGLLDVEAVAKLRFSEEPAQLRKLSWWTDEAFIEQAEWDVLCCNYKNCPIEKGLRKLGKGLLALSGLVSIGDADWKMLEHDADLRAPFRKTLHKLLAASLITEAEGYLKVVSLLEKLKKLGLLEEVACYKRAIRLDLPAIFAKPPTADSALVAAEFFDESLTDAARAHLIEGYKLAVIKGGTGKRFAALLGDAAAPATLLAHFSSSDPVFGREYAKKHLADWDDQSCDVLWQLGKDSLEDFLPYFRRYLPTQGQLATLPPTDACLELFFCAAAAGLDSEAHVTLVRKGAQTDAFLALQKDRELLWRLSKSPEILPYMSEQVLLHKDVVLARQVLQDVSAKQALTLVCRWTKEVWPDDFWGDVALHIQDPEAIHLALAAAKRVKCKHFLAAHQRMGLAAFRQLVEAVEACEDDDYSELVLALLKTYKDKGAYLAIVFALGHKDSNQQAFLQLYPRIAVHLDEALWREQLTPTIAFAVLLKLFSALPEACFLETITACFHCLSQQTPSVAYELFRKLSDKTVVMEKLLAIADKAGLATVKPHLFLTFFAWLRQASKYKPCHSGPIFELLSGMVKLFELVADENEDYRKLNNRELPSLGASVRNMPLSRVLPALYASLAEVTSAAAVLKVDSAYWDSLYSLISSFGGARRSSQLATSFFDARMRRLCKVTESLVVLFKQGLQDESQIESAEFQDTFGHAVREFAYLREFEQLFLHGFRSPMGRLLAWIQDTLMKIPAEMSRKVEWRFPLKDIRQLFYAVARIRNAGPIAEDGLLHYQLFSDLFCQCVDKELGPDEDWQNLLDTYMEKVDLQTPEALAVTLVVVKKLAQEGAERLLLTREIKHLQIRGDLAGALVRAGQRHIVGPSGMPIIAAIDSMCLVLNDTLQSFAKIAEMKVSGTLATDTAHWQDVDAKNVRRLTRLIDADAFLRDLSFLELAASATNARIQEAIAAMRPAAHIGQVCRDIEKASPEGALAIMLTQLPLCADEALAASVSLNRMDIFHLFKTKLYVPSCQKVAEWGHQGLVSAEQARAFIALADTVRERIIQNASLQLSLL